MKVCYRSVHPFFLKVKVKVLIKSVSGLRLLQRHFMTWNAALKMIVLAKYVTRRC